MDMSTTDKAHGFFKAVPCSVGFWRRERYRFGLCMINGHTAMILLAAMFFGGNGMEPKLGRDDPRD